MIDGSQALSARKPGRRDPLSPPAKAPDAGFDRFRRTFEKHDDQAVVSAWISVRNPAPSGGARGHRNGTVLLVDDGEIVRASAASMLESLGYEVIMAASGTEAISILSRQRNKACPTKNINPALTIDWI